MYVAAVIFIVYTKMNMVVFFFLINFRLLLCLCQRPKIENKLGRVGGSHIVGMIHDVVRSSNFAWIMRNYIYLFPCFFNITYYYIYIYIYES